MSKVMVAREHPLKPCEWYSSYLESPEELESSTSEWKSEVLPIETMATLNF